MSAQFNSDQFSRTLFGLSAEAEFNRLALELFRFQLAHNPVYAEYVRYLGRAPENVSHYRDIPFMPIGFFRTHRVASGQFREETIFLSSGTAGMQRSRHFVRSLDIYRNSCFEGFKHFYADPAETCFLGLLPSYLERSGSSLVYMVDQMIRAGNYKHSGFYLDEYEELARHLSEITRSGIPTVLIGVSFALLDFAESHPQALGDNIIIMETGGMKGRRKELTREDMHKRLCNAFGKKSIHSEYGMTELLSQAYSRGDGRFRQPPWMKVMIRDIQDPFRLLPAGETGAINIIDLANMHSCAFIETQDIGRLHADGSFEVLGRTDASDIRGCSLLLA